MQCSHDDYSWDVDATLDFKHETKSYLSELKVDSATNSPLPLLSTSVKYSSVKFFQIATWLSQKSEDFPWAMDSTELISCKLSSYYGQSSFESWHFQMPQAEL